MEEDDKKILFLKRFILILCSVGPFFFGHFFCMHPISDDFKKLILVKRILEGCIWVYSIMSVWQIGLFDIYSILCSDKWNKLHEKIQMMILAALICFSFFMGIVTFDEIDVQSRMEKIFRTADEKGENAVFLDGTEIEEIISATLRITFYIDERDKPMKISDIKPDETYKVESVKSVEGEWFRVILDFPVYLVRKYVYNEKYYSKVYVKVSVEGEKGTENDLVEPLPTEKETEIVDDEIEKIKLIEYENTEWYIDGKDFFHGQTEGSAEEENAREMCRLGEEMLCKLVGKVTNDVETYSVQGSVNKLDNRIVVSGSECSQFQNILEKPLYIRCGPQIIVRAQINEGEERAFFANRVSNDTGTSYEWQEQENMDDALIVLKINFDTVKE